MISSSMLILFYTIQQVIPNICTKFHIPRCSSSREIFDTNFPMYYIWARDWKKEKWTKKAKINHSILVFFPTINLALLKVYTKFEDSGSHRSHDFYDVNFYWREKNGQIKGMIRLILFYTIQVMPNICTKFQNPQRSSSWKIFDKKKNSLHTHNYWKDKNYIPPIYFLCRGYIESLCKVEIHHICDYVVVFTIFMTYLNESLCKVEIHHICGYVVVFTIFMTYFTTFGNNL